MNRRVFTPREEALIRRLRADGAGLERIARRLGTGANTVRRVLDPEGAEVEQRRVEARRDVLLLPSRPRRVGQTLPWEGE